MGLTFRKSVKIGSGTRLNLSSSGIGISTGVKGFRVSTGPRGTYVTIGGHGIYYREKIAGPYGILQNPDAYGDVKTSGKEQITPSADALQLVSSDAALTLAKINETVNLPSSWPSTAFIILLPVLVVSAATLLALFPRNFVSIFVAACVAAIMLAIITIDASAQEDAAKRTYSMNYDLDNLAQTRYQAILDAVAILNQNNRLRCIVSSYDTPDTKYNAGADIFDRALNASCGPVQPPSLKTNIMPFCLDLGKGNQKLYILPDRIYVYQRGEEVKHNYGAVEYGDLNFDCYTQQEAMDPVVAPTDSEVLRKTYEKVNKDGTRDRRFSHNRELVVCRVGCIKVTSAQGLNVVLEVSKASTAKEFVEAYQNATLMPTRADIENNEDTQLEATTLAVSSSIQEHRDLIKPQPVELVEGGYLPCPCCGFLNTPLDERCSRCHAHLSSMFEDNEVNTQSEANRIEPIRQQAQEEMQEVTT